MASLWTKTGVLKLCASGALAYQSACPCSSSSPCPGSCTGCPSSYSLNITGFGSACSSLNTTVTIGRASCAWNGSIGPNSVSLTCSGSTWTLTIRNVRDTVVASGTVTNTSGCPPTGSGNPYTLTGVSTCAGLSGVGVLT